jgi:hypothetical protein
VTDSLPDPEQDEAPGRQAPPGLCFLIGVGAAVVGLLPWLVTGLRLPLQNLWATESTPEQMPLVLLPFSQYALTLIIGLVVTGAALAGLIVRAARPRLPQRGVGAVVVGVLVVHVVAMLQTASTVRAGLAARPESTLYLAVLVAVTGLSVLVGVLALGLIALGPRGAAVVGMSIGTLAFAPWLSSLIIPFGSINSSPATLRVLAVARWVPAVLIGAAIAWSGLRTGLRVAAAGVALLLLWVVPALTTAISSSAGSRVLAHDPREMAQYATEVFRAALTLPGLVLPPLVLAVVVALLGIFGHRVLRHRG